ncbi:MAG: protein translocase subunit SecD [Ruminiclostridium sp.]|nr:protein translocase subunit SecD [Ruminiclostridium sp.]
MKGNNGFKFFLVIAVIAILTFISFSGSFFGIKVPGSVYNIRQGIDINGGISATLYAITTDKSKPITQDQLDSARNVIEKRLDKLSILDRQVSTDVNSGTILLEMPWKPGEKNFDPDKAIAEIGKTALLTFQEVDPKKIDANGYYISDAENKPYGKVVLEGKYVVSANPQKSQSGSMEVALKLDAEGTKLFADATQKLLNKPIAIYMDDQFISAPRVAAHITDGNAVITLGGSANNDAAIKEARDLAETIRSGSLPFKLDAKQVNGISPLLGKGALSVTVTAAIVAFILVCLFMIGYYRLPGILACIALVGHTVLQLLFISWLGITITLPGLAGIILTIGMGVDANVIIFERIKEELRSGKTLRAAIDVGFKRAFTAILDANVTTLIAAVVLFMFGTGPMLSFAFTLGIGVLLSFLTAVTVSRIMIKSVADLDIAKHHWLYGV